MMSLPNQAEIHRRGISRQPKDRRGAARLLKKYFSSLPDKDQAWQDLINLTQDGDPYVRRIAANTLGTAISYVLDKEQARQDLIKLAQDKDRSVRWCATYALEIAFSQVPNKEQAWQDLIKLAQDKDRSVRWCAADSLEIAFSQVPNKEQAWQDLHRLAFQRDRNVRLSVARALGTAIKHIHDKEQVREDLIRLANDKDSLVRTCAFHSLGKASIYEATETHDKAIFKKELEVAIAFFEKSSQESEYSPASFCHPFYRSYLAIIFHEAKENEVQRYLADAKIAVGGSRSKELLLEAVENLAYVMEKIQMQIQNINAGDNWEEIQKDLKEIYEPYCNRAAELLDESNDLAPEATKFVRKAFPLINEHIKSTIAEIKTKSRALCRATSGSEIFRPLGTDLNRLAQGLSANDELKCLKTSMRIVPFLQGLCKVLPHEKREHVCEIIADIRTHEGLPDILNRILEAITYLQPNIELAAYESKNAQMFMDLQIELGVVNNKLDEIRHAAFKQKICSGNIISNLIAIMTELEKLRQVSLLHPDSSLMEIYSCQEEQLQELSKDIDDRFVELKDILKEKASTDDIKKLERLKPAETWSSKFWNQADKGATLLTYIAFLQDSIAILKPLLVG